MSSATDIHPTQPRLSSNDSAVLQALFDAESAPSSAVKIDSTLPSLPGLSPQALESLRNRERGLIRRLQSPNPSRGTVESVITELDHLIKKNPSYPSAYMNRAQAMRMLFDLDDEDALFAPETVDIASQIFSDLGQAIALATPRSPADPVSPLQARILADAHTHRGYILLKAAKVRLAGSDGGPDRLRGLEKDQLEEMASRDFFLGGRYGNRIAQQLAVQTNPYAKMCGAIVKEAMRKEVEGV
ncbi:conserved hypothetical protein [Paecilomyces variotii No. 5]|uniref:Uncharacterized protein n=1 Tax=Byssochlamys spectabilis (strain No. 5 / NBRC 109023) TaxID=1356009 RepID=V5FIH9_BYSSN|nr:conserved hypothetical protein [Paecilomyces variotii No. 5]